MIIKPVYACRDRCETIWVCQKILASCQLASRAARNLKSICATSRSSHWKGLRLGKLAGNNWNLRRVSHSSSRFCLGLGCLDDVHLYVSTKVTTTTVNTLHSVPSGAELHLMKRPEVAVWMETFACSTEFNNI